MKTATADNTRLIKSIPDEMAERIAGKVRAGWDAGKRHETLAKELEAEFGIASRRARLIARDQVNKINGSFTRARHLAAGITHFRWQSGRDNRVRPAHLALNGRVFAWDQPPDEGFPGQPIQCRCTAAPVVSEREITNANGRLPAQQQPGPDKNAASVPLSAAKLERGLPLPPASVAIPITDSPISVSRLEHVDANSPHVVKGLASLEMVDTRLLQVVNKKGGEISFASRHVTEHPSVAAEKLDDDDRNALGIAFPQKMLAVVTGWPPDDHMTTLHEFGHLLHYAVPEFASSDEFKGIVRGSRKYIHEHWLGRESYADEPDEAFAEGFALFHWRREQLARHAPELHSYFKGLPHRVGQLATSKP